MGEQAVEQVMAVLPDALRDDERRAGVQLAEHLHAHLLRINEPVLLGRVVGMCANGLPTFGLEGRDKHGFHPGLFRPAFLVGTEAQVAVGHQTNLLRFQSLGRLHVPFTPFPGVADWRAAFARWCSPRRFQTRSEPEPFAGD